MLYGKGGSVVRASEKQETREFHGRPFVLETALTGDFAFVKAHRGDAEGNLVYRKTARNFNPMMATAGRVTLAEVEELLDTGTIDPEIVHTSGIYVDVIFKGSGYEKRIEQRTTRPQGR